MVMGRLYLVMNYFISLRGPRTSEAIEYRGAVKRSNYAHRMRLSDDPTGAVRPLRLGAAGVNVYQLLHVWRRVEWRVDDVGGNEPHWEELVV